MALKIGHGVTSSYTRFSILANLGLEPVFIRFLEDDSAHVRTRAASVLGSWGPSADAPALLKLLEDEDAGVRRSAAEVLGLWRTNNIACQAIVRDLVDDDRVVKFLGQKRAEKASYDLATVLVAVISREETDPVDIQGRREIIYNWLWELSEDAQTTSPG